MNRWIVLMLFLLIGKAYGQADEDFKNISLQNLNDFQDPPANWIIASDAKADYHKIHDLQPVKGTGAVVDDFSKNNRMHLYTKDNFGDLEVELDFMMAKNSNSGVYLQGRYEVQLLDSWTRLNPNNTDEGAIYSRWNEQRGTFEGTPPLMNVARAPGLWQHLQLKFRAPQFDAGGKKIKDARFEEVHLNGTLVQQAVNVTGPTASSMFQDEVSMGPLVLQGDHGPVAFKNIRYRLLPASKDTVIGYTDYTYWEYRNPIIINPQVKNYVLRSFMDHGDKKLTHIISIGSPSKVNFAYDLKEGAIIKIWRGDFLDVTRMWVGRGEPQLAVPLGSVINFKDAPEIAVLPFANEAWPDSVAFDDLQSHGYVLNKKKDPVFTYTINATDIKDSIVCMENGEGITRTVSVAKNAENLYCRIVEGKNIAQMSESLYAVDDKKFYILLDKSNSPVIRATLKGQEMIVKLTTLHPVVYSFIW